MCEARLHKRLQHVCGKVSADYLTITGVEGYSILSNSVCGTVLYTNPDVFVDFFSVPNEWGVSVSFSKAAAVHTTQADVGSLSVYNIIVGQGQDC